jgi:hypothetical protein
MGALAVQNPVSTSSNLIIHIHHLNTGSNAGEKDLPAKPPAKHAD